MALEPPTLRHDRALELLSELRRLTGGMRYRITTPGTSSTMSVHDQVSLNFDTIERAIKSHREPCLDRETVEGDDQMRAMSGTLYRGDEVRRWHPEAEL